MRISINLSVIDAFRDARERRGSVNSAPILLLCELEGENREARDQFVTGERKF